MKIKTIFILVLLLMMCVPNIQGSLIDDIKVLSDKDADEAARKADEAARKAAYAEWLSYMIQNGLYDRLFRLYRPWLIIR